MNTHTLAWIILILQIVTLVLIVVPFARRP
jgi:hypothetical protein